MFCASEHNTLRFEYNDMNITLALVEESIMFVVLELLLIYSAALMDVTSKPLSEIAEYICQAVG